jgi:hypothetical protein
MRLTLAAPILLLLAMGAFAHNVPVVPSTCTFDPIEVTASGRTIVVSPAGPSDQLTITYDNSTASLATFDMRSVPPRPLTVDGAAGTLGFPGLFQAKMSASGDLVVASLTLTLGSELVPVSLTTALAAADGVVVEGAPIRGDGRFTFVAVSTAGVASLGGARMFLRFGCQALPPPDLDQFATPSEVTMVTGGVRKATMKLHAAFRTDQQDAPDLSSVASILRVSAGSDDVAALSFPTGLARHGKSFVGDASDGSRLTVRVPRSKAPARYAVKVRATGVAAPGAAATSLQVTLALGSVTARVNRPFRTTGTGFRITR